MFLAIMLNVLLYAGEEGSRSALFNPTKTTLKEMQGRLGFKAKREGACRGHDKSDCAALGFSRCGSGTLTVRSRREPGRKR